MNEMSRDWNGSDRKVLFRFMCANISCSSLSIPFFNRSVYAAHSRLITNSTILYQWCKNVRHFIIQCISISRGLQSNKYSNNMLQRGYYDMKLPVLQTSVDIKLSSKLYKILLFCLWCAKTAQVILLHCNYVFHDATRNCAFSCVTEKPWKKHQSQVVILIALLTQRVLVWVHHWYQLPLLLELFLSFGRNLLLASITALLTLRWVDLWLELVIQLSCMFQVETHR